MVCGNEGTIVFYNIKEKKEIRATHPENMPIEDAQWNPREDYLLVCYKDSTMRLFEADKEKESFEFDQQGVGNISLK